MSKNQTLNVVLAHSNPDVGVKFDEYLNDLSVVYDDKLNNEDKSNNEGKNNNEYKVKVFSAQQNKALLELVKQRTEASDFVCCVFIDMELLKDGGPNLLADLYAIDSNIGLIIMTDYSKSHLDILSLDQLKSNWSQISLNYQYMPFERKDLVSQIRNMGALWTKKKKIS